MDINCNCKCNVGDDEINLGCFNLIARRCECGGTGGEPESLLISAEMTSDNEPYPFEASASSTVNVAGYSPSGAFRTGEALESVWASGSGTFSPSTGVGDAWCQIKIAKPEKLHRYTIRAWHNPGQGAGGFPRDWQVLGSNDGVDFTVVDTRVDQSVSGDSEIKEYILPVEPAEPFQYYRFHITKNNRKPEPYVVLRGVYLYKKA